MKMPGVFSWKGTRGLSLSFLPITFAEEQVRHGEHDANQEDQAGRKVANSKVRGGGKRYSGRTGGDVPRAVAGSFP